MQKKSVSLLLIFTFVLFFGACRREVRVDFSELLRRMEKYDENIVLRQEDAFFSDGSWFLYVSVLSEKDHLLSAIQDENGLVTSVCISTLNTYDENKGSAFVKICENLGNAFVAENVSVTELFEEAGLYKENAVFSDETGVAESGRYKVSLFNTDIGSTLVIDLVY